jgi:hypothetical protein
MSYSDQKKKLLPNFKLIYIKIIHAGNGVYAAKTSMNRVLKSNSNLPFAQWVPTGKMVLLNSSLAL